MKKLIFTTALLCSFNLWAQVTVDVVLNPMGNFKAKTDSISGVAEVTGTDVSAKNVRVDLRTLKTGIEVRDKHTQKHLHTDKFPEAILSIAKGKNGKGIGRISINGQEKEIKGTYKIVGKNLEADFSLNLPDFKITDINYMGVGVEDEVKLHVIIPIGTAAATPAAPVSAPAKVAQPVAPVKAVMPPAKK
ncbi:YceI family protein [Bdellovibrio sp. qaytius]|nr:YceI family protein [Bdellovibrio sp. qaytius]